MVLSRHPASTRRGVSRSSRTLEAGSDGREGAQRACRADESILAYGEIVRSRFPDAGIKLLARRSREATVARKPGAPRRTRISRKTIARGMPAVSAALSLLACAKCTFLCTQGSRVRPASGVPRALFFRGTRTMQDPDANCVAGSWTHGSAATPSQA